MLFLRLRFLCVALLCLLLVTGASVLPTKETVGTVARAASPIQHIVFIAKENRTFDSLFGRFTCADGSSCVNGATTGLIKVNGQDQVISLNVTPDQSPNFCHEWSCAHKAVDGGAMDAFNLAVLHPTSAMIQGTKRLRPITGRMRATTSSRTMRIRRKRQPAMPIISSWWRGQAAQLYRRVR